MKVVRLYHPSGADRVAIVSAEPAFQDAGRFLVRLARGPKASSLTGGGVYGPFDADEAEARIDQLAAQLRSEGFLESGTADLIRALDDPFPATRARAALKLGWRRHVDAAEKLIAMLDTSIDELCSVIDALGAMGDPRAIAPIRKIAQRKLLSRRRSAVEALRQLEDSIGLADAHQRALGELPAPLADAVQVSHADPQPICDALDSVESKRLGLYLDILYEIATPACVAAVRSRLATLVFAQPFVWRYVKSIFKRAMLRHDHQMFGWLAHALEQQSMHPKRVSATVKSGYDGKSRKTSISSRKTGRFLRRLTWRHLRQLAQHRPDQYAHAAAEAVAAYVPADAVQPRGLQGQLGHCYVLQRVLYGGGHRLYLNQQRLAFSYRSSKHVAVPPGVREEAFPELWDEQPSAYLRILARGSLQAAIDFAMTAIGQRHPRLIEEATADALVPVLGSVHAEAAELALRELQRRFRPDAPDWDLLDAVVRADSAQARQLAQAWLASTAALWAREGSRVASYLALADAESRSVAVAALCEALRHDPEARRLVAERLLGMLRQPREPLDGVARVARDAVLAELAGQVSIEEAIAWICGELPPLQAVGADLLARRDDAASMLGWPRVAALAEHELGAVRAAAHRMLRSLGAGRGDVAALFQLVDSPWEDTRAVAIELLKASRDWAHADVDEVIGLIDSLRDDVQDFAIDLLRQHSETLDTVELLWRTAEHPHGRVRRFALELAEARLPAGADALRKMMPCLRAALLDPWPRRESKQRALRLLSNRSADREQAELAAGLLGEWVRVAGQNDFEDAMESLTGILLLHPDVASCVSLRRAAR